MHAPDNCGNLFVPEWEFDCNFNPVHAENNKRKHPIWTTLGGDIPSHVDPYIFNEECAVKSSCSLYLRNPDFFIAGELHNQFCHWEKILLDNENNNNNNTDFKAMYHEMTEADRGSELQKRESLIQQEIEEQKEREEALTTKTPSTVTPQVSIDIKTSLYTAH